MDLFTEEQVWRASLTGLASIKSVIKKNFFEDDPKGEWRVVYNLLDSTITALCNIGRDKWPETFKRLDKKYKLFAVKA